MYVERMGRLYLQYITSGGNTSKFLTFSFFMFLKTDLIIMNHRNNLLTKVFMKK